MNDELNPLSLQSIDFDTDLTIECPCCHSKLFYHVVEKQHSFTILHTQCYLCSTNYDLTISHNHLKV